ncbi:Vesicle transport v-SNARE [Babesia duncani]|uniref:Vesicle transport v-SNARE n=1 Tax=Babesia duncani TaxID=323732 RepID=A0AAD9PMD4_9APIC|nr:Vesicle transport v-SNARE [Babesia duncani]
MDNLYDDYYTQFQQKLNKVNDLAAQCMDTPASDPGQSVRLGELEKCILQANETLRQLELEARSSDPVKSENRTYEVKKCQSRLKSANDKIRMLREKQNRVSLLGDSPGFGERHQLLQRGNMYLKVS